MYMLQNALDTLMYQFVLIASYYGANIYLPITATYKVRRNTVFMISCKNVISFGKNLIKKKYCQ